MEEKLKKNTWIRCEEEQETKELDGWLSDADRFGGEGNDCVNHGFYSFQQLPESCAI